MRETLQKMRSRLKPKYGREESEAMIRLIFHNLLGWGVTDMLKNDDATLPPTIRRRIGEILERLEADEPLQYILGEAYFYGMNLKVGEGVLIPRPETAQLVDMVVNAERERSDLRVLDLCTGSGAIAIALARNLRFPEVTALELSEKALKYARENAVLLKAKVHFVQGDIFTYTPAEPQDVIVSNPPYITTSEALAMERNVLDYEPFEALFVPDTEPLRYYKRIAEIARESLLPGGRLYLEVNSAYGEEVKRLLEPMGSAEVHRDSYGNLRFVTLLKDAER